MDPRAELKGPLNQDLPDQRTVGSPLWVKSRHSASLTGCPLYPRKRTSESGTFMSVMGEIADSCATAIYRLSPGGLPRVSAVSGRQPPKFVAAARVQGVRGSKLLRVKVKLPWRSPELNRPVRPRRWDRILIGA